MRLLQRIDGEAISTQFRPYGDVRVAGHQSGEPVDEILQELSRNLVADMAVLVDQIRLEGDGGLAAQDDHAEAGHDRTRMLAHRRAGD